MSGVIPQIAALMGPCAAGTAYIPGPGGLRADGQGPRLDGARRARTWCGRRSARTSPRRNSAARACTAASSGVGDMEVADDEECIERIKQYLSFMPQNCEAAGRRCGRSATRSTARDEELLDVLPESNRKPYDMYEVIRRIVDDGEYFDMKGQWAKTIITCFARFGGRPAGIVANQPKQLGGILDNDSADKAARFVNLCNAFAIPLVFLQDVPGLHGRHEGRGRGHHPPRREDALRGRQRDRAEDHGDHAQGLRRRLLRDERPRVRAGPDRRLAERGDQRDGRRGRRSRS